MWGAAAAPDRDPATSAASDDDGDGGFVDQGVRAAYTVMDAYLRQGRRVARSIGRYSLPNMMRGQRARGQQARFLQLTSELTANWFDLLGLVTESLVPLLEPEREPGAADEQPETPEPKQPAATSVAVAYDIASTRPALVQLDFQPGKATSRLKSHGLRSFYDGCTPIAASFDARDEHAVVVTIHVPDNQPPGLYTDVLLDSRTGRIVGSMSLELR